MSVTKIVSHSHRVASIARQYGWLPGARYTNLRDVRKFDRLGFLDIDWKSYDFGRHLLAAKATKPILTVAKDIESMSSLDEVIDQAYQLKEHSAAVILVPKAIELAECMEEVLPKDFDFGFSVPTRYGGTAIPPACFVRDVHLLGGRPDVQRKLANKMNVISIDCNRFTLDAAFGDYFDGEIFRPHPEGGYEKCIEASLENINSLWDGYNGAEVFPLDE